MRRSRCELDLTPMLDVLLMLIIFFVITSSFNRLTLNEVSLPRSKGNISGDETSAALTIVVQKDGYVEVNNRRLSPGELKDLVKSRRQDTNAKILLGAHKDAPYGRVVQVLDILKDSGISSAGLLTEDPR